MLQNLRQFNLLNSFFNIRGGEWLRVLFSIGIKFLYRTAFVIVWTVLVAIFVSRYGILALPYLFVVNAVFSIIGSILFSLFLEKLSRVAVMVTTIVVSGILIFIAALVANTNQIVFFSLLILAVSIFLNQLRIIMIAYVEELFDPLTSERAFPIIEVSETLGGIVAGFLVIFLSNYFALTTFLYLIVSILFLLVPILLLFDFKEHEVELVSKKSHAVAAEGIFNQMKASFDTKVHSSFVIGMIFIVLFQWIIFNLLEFQYTGAVYQNVSQVIFEAGGGFENAFIHDLGLLFILFSTSALLVEIFLGSRLITGLGVIGAMLLHPIVTFFSVLGLSLRFDFLTAVLAKNNFTLTSVIHTNTYHISYYAIREKAREHIRNFLEGIVRPFGALLGTLMVILLENLFFEESLIYALNVAMLICTVLFFYIIYRQQEKYTRVVTEELLNSKEKHVRLNAVDLLAQRGHKFAFEKLQSLLNDTHESDSLKVRILNVMSELQTPELVLDIVNCLKSKRLEVCEAALDTLISFRFLHGNSSDYLFIKYRLISGLKDLYSREKNKEVLAKVIYLMSLLSNVSTVEFLFNVLNSAKSGNKADAIYALGKCKDDEIVHVLNDYLVSTNLQYQINAAMALANFRSSRSEAFHVINSFIYSEKKEKIVYGLFAAGELNLHSKKSICLKYLESTDVDLKLAAAIALAKMGFFHSVSSLLELLFAGDIGMIKKIKRSLKNVDVRISKNIDKIIKEVVARKIDELKAKNNNNMELFSGETLEHQKNL